MRYRLRTLLIVLALLPPIIAWWLWPTLKTWLAAKPPPVPPVSVTVETPYVVFYEAAYADPMDIENAVKLAGTPATIERDKQTGRIQAVCSESAHQVIQAAIRKARKPPQDSN